MIDSIGNDHISQNISIETRNCKISVKIHNFIIKKFHNCIIYIFTYNIFS